MSQQEFIDTFPIFLASNFKADHSFLEKELIYFQDRKGHTEAFFQLVLQHFFLADRLYASHGFKWRPKYTLRPDFILFRKTTGISLALEIDEPYDLHRKKPLHFPGKDRFKNRFLIERGIHVLRLSEDQVIENHVPCVELIESILAGNANFSLLEKQARWTKEEAIQLANDKTREKKLELAGTLKSLYVKGLNNYLTKKELKMYSPSKLLKIAREKKRSSENP